VKRLFVQEPAMLGWRPASFIATASEPQGVYVMSIAKAIRRFGREKPEELATRGGEITTIVFY